nr:MAG TPA: portal [Caudoviricetes sp.]
MDKNINQGKIDSQTLESIFRTSKKTIQEYVSEIERNCRYKSTRSQVVKGVILDDRSRLIDLYEACVQQDAHIRSVLETLESQIIGERYMLARQNANGQYVRDVEATKKIQGSQFIKIIKGIAESKLYGYTLIEINPTIDPITGKLNDVNLIERRNVLPEQKTVLKRQGIWLPNWDLETPKYKKNYILINSGDLGLFSATTPLILAKKFTLANYINFSHTYGQPIIHGKSESENLGDRNRLANDIASAATNRVIVTGLNDDIDIKAFTMSNSEKIYTSLIELVNAEVSNLILGSESMAGATQSYVGSTKAHQDIFRDRIKVYREYIENAMNEEIIPRLVAMGYIENGLEFKYSGGLEMSVESKIDLYDFLSDKYEIEPDEIAKEFGVVVKKQFNNPAGWNDINNDGKVDDKDNVVAGGSMGAAAPASRRRYRRRSSSSVANYLQEVMNGRRDIR